MHQCIQRAYRNLVGVNKWLQDGWGSWRCWGGLLWTGKQWQIVGIGPWLIIPVQHIQMEEGKEDERGRVFIPELNIVNLCTVMHVEAAEEIPAIHPIKIYRAKNKLQVVEVKPLVNYRSMVVVMCSQLFTFIHHRLRPFVLLTCQFYLTNDFNIQGEAEGAGGHTGEGW